MSYTLGTAAKACGKSRTTIFRAIKNGKISAHKDENGNYLIEPAELHRVFQSVLQQRNTKQQMDYDATANVTSETAMLHPQILHLQEERERERSQLQGVITDLRSRLDQSEQERRDTQIKLTALLTHTPITENRPNNKSWISFIILSLAALFLVFVLISYK